MQRFQHKLNSKREPFQSRESVWTKTERLSPYMINALNKNRETKLVKVKSVVRGNKIYYCPVCGTYFNLKGVLLPRYCLFCMSFTQYRKKRKLQKTDKKHKKGFCTQCLQWPISLKKEIKKWELCESCFTRLTRRHILQKGKIHGKRK